AADRTSGAVIPQTVANSPINAARNWWGSADGPGSGASTSLNSAGAAATTSPWIASYTPGTAPSGFITGVGFWPTAMTYAAPCSTTCYVNATTGDDTYPGTAGAPFKTIQKGVNAVTAGGTVNVAAGTYSEDVTIAKALTLSGAKAGTPAGPASSPAGRSTSSPYTGESVVDGRITVGAVSGVTIDGFVVAKSDYPVFLDGSLTTTVKNSIVIANGGVAGTGYAVKKMLSSSDATYALSANRIVGGYSGVLIGGDTAGSSWLVDRNYFSTSTIAIETTTAMNATATYSNNRIADSTNGIMLAESYSGTVVRSNSIALASGGVSAIKCGSFGANCAGLQVLGNLIDAPSSGYGVYAAYATGTANRFVGNRFTGAGAYVNLAAPVSGTVVDATGNWWNNGGAGPAALKVEAGGATVTTSPYITSYTDDPDRALAGDPGFWPNPVTLGVACAVSPCTATATIENSDFGSPSLALNLDNVTATVSAGDVPSGTVPDPGEVTGLAASVAKFVDLSVDFSGDGTPPAFFTICADGAAPSKLWHYEDPDDYDGYGFDETAGNDPAQWRDITNRDLDTLSPVSGKLCGQVVSLSPVAVGPTSVPTTTSLDRTFGTEISTYGDSLKFTATVTPTAGTATGTVELRDASNGDAIVDTCALSSGSCVLDAESLGVGSHSVFARYVGDEASGDDLDPSDSSTVAQTIVAATLTVTPNAEPVKYGAVEPSYSFVLTGFKNGETALTLADTPPTCDSDYTAGTAVAASPRTISCGASPLGTAGSAGNYVFDYAATASVTISARSVIADANDVSVKYGDAAPGSYAFTVGGDG
ncbi:MAG: Ig-like domain repeat protein, partial [Actinomycetota bacterium]